MKIIVKILAGMAFSTLICSCRGAGLDVIPVPSDVNVSESLCKASSLKTVCGCEGLENEVDFLVSSLGVKAVGKGGDIILSINEDLGGEAYVMKVSGRKVRICGGSAAGVFYGIQTLIQEVESYGGARKGTVSDSPRYSWRGYMLDESRHFFGEKNVKTLLDMMAKYKLNKFHWHLTDSPGWRIEIKAYPDLTITGSIGCHSDATAPSAFYTQEQIRDIVDYASRRHIEIIPEIDMPGHGNSATRSHPELAVASAGSFTYNPGKEEVYEFLTEVLKEVAGLFPGDYIHIGGDEVFYGNDTWNSDPSIQNLISHEGLDGIKGAEKYFIERMSKVVKSLGKKMLAWDDVLELGLENDNDNNMITWWRHDRQDHLTQCMKEGYGTIMCPRIPLYFDFVQDKDHKVGRIWPDGSFCPLKDVYVFPDSLFDEWDDEGAGKDFILGFQANLWSEVVKTDKRLQFMTYPRICALAESAWSPACKKDFEDFTQRLEAAYKLFENLNLYFMDYRDPSRTPEPAL